MIDDSKLYDLFQTALIAAQSAGKLIKHSSHNILHIDKKGRVNLVTEVDRRSEELIISIIHDSFPEHRILAEETDEIVGNSPYRWIIDPLDGTTNFVHGFPVYAVSIAVEFNGKIIIGVVFDPNRNELFSAIEDTGAFLNNKRLNVSQNKALSDSLTATGFPYETGTAFEINMKIFKSVYEVSQGIRRAGSAALDLCYVAAGRFDGFWEFGLNPWDVAAGALIVKEAGGTVTCFRGNQFQTDKASEIIATNGRIHNELLQIINTNRRINL
ncbi:MAG: inositol monophosphatase [Candidatus Neomarinimicrobiota bacterium]|nr:MAG: inositol monophosphatase [Candidatus Neomarinimicrobiota bacterium]